MAGVSITSVMAMRASGPGTRRETLPKSVEPRPERRRSLFTCTPSDRKLCVMSSSSTLLGTVFS
jgi:hypothetical protein